MTDTVRIMPRQPIGAKRDEFGEGYYTERGTSIVHRDYLNSGGVGWVEVSDPITWDGSDEVLGEIARLFPTSTLYPHTHIQGRNAFGDIRIVDYARYPKTGSAGILVLGGRIRIEGDSFAILPPEEVPS